VGETPRQEVPRGFLLHEQTVAADILETRYDPDAVEDLTALKLANNQQIGLFQYAPGTLFQAGTGARIPPRKRTLEKGVATGRKTSGAPTPEQIRKAFERMAFAGSSNAGVPMNQTIASKGPEVSDTTGYCVMSSEERNEYWNTYHPSPPAITPPLINSRTVGKSQSSSKPSWETIDRTFSSTAASNRDGDFGGRRSSEERYELPTTQIARNSKRMSQLEDVVEEDDADAHLREKILDMGRRF
jgi:hypothetical protein